ncbi:TPA: hypothetical protein U2I45_001230 [Providencia rettgeri]|nr:hypothetical protein [Providencia rettgeri]
MITSYLINAIKHPRIKQKLHELNLYFYNRKHENQIRDEISIVINENTDYFAITEHPKNKSGAVDLSLYMMNEEVPNLIATIELKHHYPKDLSIPAVQNSIISDLTRTVSSQTSHFINIIQQRTLHKIPPVSSVKFLQRNSSDITDYTSILENLGRFPLEYDKSSHSITVQSEFVTSTYTFDIYSIL